MFYRLQELAFFVFFDPKYAFYSAGQPKTAVEIVSHKVAAQQFVSCEDWMQNEVCFTYVINMFVLWIAVVCTPCFYTVSYTHLTLPTILRV